MKGCGCTHNDESLEFIIVKGIIIFKHNSDKIDIMLNKTRYHAASCTASWEACRLVSSEAGYTMKTN